MKMRVDGISTNFAPGHNSRVVEMPAVYETVDVVTGETRQPGQPVHVREAIPTSITVHLQPAEPGPLLPLDLEVSDPARFADYPVGAEVDLA